MAKDLLINVSEGEECRIALLEDGRLQELYMERTSSTSHVGNVYKGRVTNVEASIQAAFVDFGLGRNGFLHISDLMPTYFGRQGEEIHETVGRKMARRDRPPIQRCLRRGDEIVVQIIKEGIGTKGPTLTTYLSVPGKILVMMPGVGKSGVSRKIEDEVERRRLRQILDELDPPEDAGFIIRTAGIGAAKAEIQRDLSYLTRLWTTFKKKRDSGPGPMELYTEGDLITRTVRDVFTSDVDRLVIDNKDVVSRVKDVIKLANPRTRNKVELYEDPIPMFDKFGVEREIELMYSRHVPLPSGGSLVIDSTEAIVAIDINSGKSRDFSDAETTAFKTDMEAADEICRQLKLRDLGGVIICDFIDLRYERHRRELWNRLDHNLRADRAKTKVLPMSQFGIVEMTRQRMRPSLKRSVYFDCPHCKGAGLVKTPESMSLDVMRRIRIAINDQRVARVELAVCNDVAFYLQNKKRQQLGELETHYEKRIIIRADASLGLDEMRISLFDNREGVVVVEGLGMLAQPPHTTQLGTRPYQSQPRGRGGRGGGGGRSDNDRKRNDQRPSSRHEPREDEAGDDRFDRVEAEVEDREDGEPISAPRAEREDDQVIEPVNEHEHDPEHEGAEADHVDADSAETDQVDADRAETDQVEVEASRDDRPRDDRSRADRPRDDRPRDDRSRDNRQRDDRPRDDRQRDNRPRDDRQRDNRPRGDRQSADRPRDDRGGPRPDQRGGGRPQGGYRDITYGRGNDNRQGNQGNQGNRGDIRQGGGNPPDNRQGANRPDNRQGGGKDLAPVNRNPVRDLPEGGPDQGFADQNGDNQQQEGGGGRRRRRRGRRGRGRNREVQEGQQNPQAQHSSDAGDRSGLPSDERGPNDEAVRRLEDTFSEEDAVEVAADRDRQPENLDSGRYEREDRSGESEFHDRDRESEFEREPDREEDRQEDRETEREPEPEPQREPEPIQEPVAEKPASEPAEKTRRRKAAPVAKHAPKAAKAKPKAVKVAKPAKPAASAKGRKKKSPTKSARKSAAEPGGATAVAPAVVRTGSTDRHLIEDEPVLPQPARRPRSVRDLDSIPDDFDE